MFCAASTATPRGYPTPLMMRLGVAGPSFPGAYSRTQDMSHEHPGEVGTGVGELVGPACGAKCRLPADLDAGAARGWVSIGPLIGIAWLVATYRLPWLSTAIAVGALGRPVMV